MRPSSDDKDQNGADDCCYRNRDELSFDNVEVEHQGNAWWHEEEAHVGNEEVRHPFYPFLLDDLHLQQGRQKEHADDAARYGDACQPYNQFADSKATKDDETLSYHKMFR